MSLKNGGASMLDPFVALLQWQLAGIIALAYLPHAYCEVGRELQIQYFADVYPVKVEAVGYRPLYDPENVKPRS